MAKEKPRPKKKPTKTKKRKGKWIGQARRIIKKRYFKK